MNWSRVFALRPSMKFLTPLLLCCAFALQATVAHASEAAQSRYKRGYVDGRFGQMHYHMAWPAAGQSKHAPVVFFHQNPKSGVEYEYLLKEMGQDRIAIAIDTPGYGESDRPSAPPTMADLSGAMGDALDALGDYGAGKKYGKVDVFGFHTGAHIATDLALERPDLVGRVVLSGIAYMSSEERAKRIAALPREFMQPEDGTRMLNRWHRIVIQREPGVSLERATKMFVEDVHATGYWWYAYNAVWPYPIEERLPKLTQPVLILAPHDMLLNETRRAHEVALPHATYVELAEVRQESRVFETGWPHYAREMRVWLTQPVKKK